MKILFGITNGILDTKNFNRIKPLLEAAGHTTGQTNVNNDHSSIEDFDVLIVGQDWFKHTVPCVEKAKALGKKTVLLQSEGLFLDKSKWYVGKAPKCDLACLWGPIHQDIFKSRGFTGKAVVTGVPRYDLYYNFKPSIPKAECIKRLGISDISIITFTTQYFDGSQGPRKELTTAQQGLTASIAKLADLGVQPIIKMHPQERPDLTGFDRVAVAKNADPRAKVIDIEGHQETIEIGDLIYHSSILISYASSTLFEAFLLGTPSLSVNFVSVDGNIWPLPVDYGALGVATVVTTTKEMRHFVESNKNTRTEPHNTAFAEKFLAPMDGNNTKRAVEAILEYIDE